MSIFPFISPEILESGQASELPMFREYAYDFENNRLLLRDGNTYLVEGNEALRIWIFKALSTERFLRQRLWKRDPHSDRQYPALGDRNLGAEAVYH